MKNDTLKMTYIKELVEKGKKNGMLTYKEIMDSLEEIEMDPDQIDKVYEYLESRGIEVIGNIEIDISPIDDDDDDANSAAGDPSAPAAVSEEPSWLAPDSSNSDIYPNDMISGGEPLAGVSPGRVRHLGPGRHGRSARGRRRS